MAALDLITLADLKAYMPIQGTGRDAMLADKITAASQRIEDHLGRRVIYRAPPEVAGSANIVNNVALQNGVLAIAAQPNAAGRTLIVTTTGGVTAGLLTVIGTAGGQAGVVEIFDLAKGLLQHGLTFYTALTSLTVSAVSGGTNPTIQVGCSVGYVEYHTPTHSDPPRLWPYEWPVVNINEVNEDPGRAYLAASKLVKDSDFILHRPDDRDVLVRLASLLPIFWIPGWRGVRLTHSAGYRIGNVPPVIRDVCKRLVTLSYREVDKERIGISSMSDAAGNWTRFGAAQLTAEMRDDLAEFKRNSFGFETGQRDFDLEAA